MCLYPNPERINRGSFLVPVDVVERLRGFGIWNVRFLDAELCRHKVLPIRIVVFVFLPKRKSFIILRSWDLEAVKQQPICALSHYSLPPYVFDAALSCSREHRADMIGSILGTFDVIQKLSTGERLVILTDEHHLVHVLLARRANERRLLRPRERPHERLANVNLWVISGRVVSVARSRRERHFIRERELPIKVGTHIRSPQHHSSCAHSTRSIRRLSSAAVNGAASRVERAKSEATITNHPASTATRNSKVSDSRSNSSSI